MSEDGEIDVESDEVPDGFEGNSLDKRAHHNALERKRRDHIKDSFHDLRDCIPSLSGEKVSRAHILNKATEYIRQMQRSSAQRTSEIDDLKKKNELLEEQLQVLEQVQQVDNGDSMEDLLQAVTERVQQRQAQRQQVAKSAAKEDGHKPDQFKVNSNLLQIPDKLPAINFLTTQTLLNALSKNQPVVKNLAARVLASPLRQPAAGVSPRGIVTATTVSNWSSSSSSSNPPSTQQTNKPQVAVTPNTLSSSQLLDNPLAVLAAASVGPEEKATQVVTPAVSSSVEGNGEEQPPTKRPKTEP